MKKTGKAKPPKLPKPGPSTYLHYAGMASVMVLMISIGALLGRKLDSWMETDKPYMTLICVVLALFISLYIVLRDLIIKKE